MSRKNSATQAVSSIHTVTTYRHGQGQRGVRYYWPILLFVLLSAVTQLVGNLF